MEQDRVPNHAREARSVNLTHPAHPAKVPHANWPYAQTPVTKRCIGAHARADRATIQALPKAAQAPRATPPALRHFSATIQPMTQQSPFQRLRQWARALKRDVVALYLAARDPRVPWYAKAVAACVAAYALSPIDLIPDVVPILGYLDDLILVPLGIALAVRLIPAALLAEHRRAAEERVAARPTSRAAAAVIILVWVSCAAILLWWLARQLGG